MPAAVMVVHEVDKEEEFEQACEDAFYYDGRGKILVEKAIEGFEIGCAVYCEMRRILPRSVDEIQISWRYSLTLRESTK